MNETMFRQTPNYTQLNLFSDYACISNPGINDYLQNNSLWFNKFFEMITSKIKEDIFKPLFNERKMGAPNASIRMLVAISCLKDGLGMSDTDLFQTLNCDLRFRNALGAKSLEDKIPSQSTYYLFRRNLYAYYCESKIDLMEECFEQSSRNFMSNMEISGKSIRMDSKLIGSNIAWYSRYELVQLMFVRYVTPLLGMLNKSLKEKAEKIISRDSQVDQYKLDKTNIHALFTEMGIILQKIVAKAELPEEHVLRRLLREQYNCEKGKQAKPKDKSEISADSIQNPYDTDATYRKKDTQEVKGFSTNLTETVPEGDKPSIITNVTVKEAGAADNEFLQDSVKKTEKVTGQKVENIFADGAYQSESNREFAQNRNIKLYTCGLQGREGQYDYSPLEDGTIKVTDKSTGAIYIATLTKKGKQWVFRDSEGKKHYFTDKSVETSQLRKQIENIPPELMNKRNNVEASIFQYSFHTRNGKTRYRGLFKHRLHAYARCMWMNYRRVFIYITKTESTSYLKAC